MHEFADNIRPRILRKWLGSNSNGMPGKQPTTFSRGNLQRVSRSFTKIKHAALADSNWKINVVLPCHSCILTHWSRVMHICVSKLTTICYDCGLSEINYLNQCWSIVNWILGKKTTMKSESELLQFLPENAFENVFGNGGHFVSASMCYFDCCTRNTKSKHLTVNCEISSKYIQWTGREPGAFSKQKCAYYLKCLTFTNNILLYKWSVSVIECVMFQNAQFNDTTSMHFRNKLEARYHYIFHMTMKRP